VVVIGSGGATYEIFDFDRLQDRSVRLRGPMLLEVGEEIALQFSVGDAHASARARVFSHELDAGEPVTIAVLIEPPPELVGLLRTSG